MTDLVFDFEWADPLGARGAELRATWARLAMKVDDRCPSRLLDQEVRTVRDSVYLPLYPLAEWIVSNWWRLLYEMESSERAKDPLYDRRHDLRWAREGYSLPPLSLKAVGDLLQLRWEPEVLSSHRVQFLESGSAYVTLESAQRTLRSFITAVVSRLSTSGVSGTFLQREWELVGATAGEEAEFCIAAATLGLDPYDLDDSVAAAIVAVAESIPASVRREFFNVANQSKLSQESRDVIAAITTARGNNADLRKLRALRECVSPANRANGDAPWELGYTSARDLRKALKIGVQPLRSLTELAEALRVDSGNFLSAVIDQPSGVHAYEAIVATNRNDSPAFTVSRRHETAKRFQVCRGLYDFLSGHDDGPWLVTTGLSSRQKRNRAFAAEFLAPASGIRERLSSSIVSAEEVDELAQHFGVSSDAVVHQLENHGIASVAW
ncbi:MAG: hypothetical protein QOH21_1397 [Acidobacteriota bacterium]|jgi:hypothetical protein|nr:hypothetical protein [Acidobacteriota bacterium]